MTASELYDLRIRAGMDRREMARFLGITSSSYESYELGWAIPPKLEFHIKKKMNELKESCLIAHTNPSFR